MTGNSNPSERLRSGTRKRLRIVGPSTARGRFRVILPLLRFRSRQAVRESPRVLLPSGAEIFTLTELARHRARQSHVSERQVFRWLKLFERGGYAALTDHPRKDKGISRAFSKRPAVVAFVTVRHYDGWTAVAIHESLRQVWAYLTRDSSRLPSLATLRAFLKLAIPARVLRTNGNG